MAKKSGEAGLGETPQNSEENNVMLEEKEKQKEPAKTADSANVAKNQDSNPPKGNLKNKSGSEIIKVRGREFDRNSIFKDFNSFFDKLRIKLIEFEEYFSKDEDKQSCENLKSNIRYWAAKINDFENIENPNKEDVEKIMQLHDEIKNWTKKNWKVSYRTGKFDLANVKFFKGKEDESAGGEKVLHSLSDTELHGENSPIKKNLSELEMSEKVAALEKKYGKIGTDYIRYKEKGGFPLDGFTIIRYEIGQDGDDFVIVDRLVSGENISDASLEKENIEVKINLKEFKKYKKGYWEDRNVDNKSNEAVDNIVELTKEEKEEMEKLIQEKLLEISSGLAKSDEIIKKIEKGLISENDLDGIKRKISSYSTSLAGIKSLINNDRGIYKDTKIVDIATVLADKVERLVDDLTRFEEVQHEKEAMFDEKQREEMQFIAKAFEEEKFLERLMNESDWGGYRQEDKTAGVELIVKAELRLTLKEMMDVFKKDEIIEKAVAEIFDILNKK